MILAVLQRQSEPLGVRAIVELLLEEQEKGNWPEATWQYAAPVPYDVGVYQHLRAMLKQGIVEEVDRLNASGGWKVRQESLVKHAAEAMELQAAGKTRKEICSILGISMSRVARVLSDPTGAEERLRKRRYCPGCGAKKNVSATTCEKCVSKKAEALLPPDTFLMVARRYQARTGCPVLFGVTPGLQRVIRIQTARGVSEHVLDPMDSWEDALVDAGVADG